MARGAVRWSVLLGLALALIAPYTVALSKNDLYQYAGPGSLALESDPNRMLISAEAILKTPIVFYDKIYNSIFVSTESDFFFFLISYFLQCFGCNFSIECLFILKQFRLQNTFCIMNLKSIKFIF